LVSISTNRPDRTVSPLPPALYLAYYKKKTMPLVLIVCMIVILCALMTRVSMLTEIVHNLEHEQTSYITTDEYRELARNMTCEFTRGDCSHLPTQ
jgi:hypothetical protein